MPGSFVFRNDFSSFSFLPQTELSQGTGAGIDDNKLFSAQGGAFTFSNNAVNIVAIAVKAGQTLSLDVDFGLDNNINPIDTELWLVDANGKLLASNDTSSKDAGSATINDPKLDYTALATGMVFAVVTQNGNDYLDGTFGFSNSGTDSGVFQLNVGIAGLAPLTLGTTGDDYRNLVLSEVRFDAMDGNDTVFAAEAASTIDGGAGNDTLNGGSKRDILSGGDGNDYVWGGDSADVLVGGRDEDNLYGGLGNDQMFGGDGLDYMDGGGNADLMWGEAAADGIDGGEGDDVMHGGGGNDTFYINAGDDVFDGGAGIADSIYGYGAAGPVIIDLSLTGPQNTGSGMDTFSGIEDISGSNGYGDTLRGSGIANYINGMGGNDKLYGQGGFDTLYGSDGNDKVYGGLGDDYVNGGTGDDYLYGDAGSDSLAGGTGADRLFGGASIDYFYYYSESESPATAADIIADFSHTTGDKISLTGVSPLLLEFRGADPFLNTGGEVRAVDLGAYQRVYVNLDTDSDAEMIIRVNTPDPLVAGDFYL